MQGRICMTCVNSEVIVTEQDLKVLDSPLFFFSFLRYKNEEEYLIKRLLLRGIQENSKPFSLPDI